MPMIVVGTEKNLAALKPRLFTGKVSNAALRDTNAAIKAANPDVNLDSLEPGTVLNVPDAPQVAVRGNLSLDDTTTGMLASLAEAVGGALDEVVAQSKARDAEATAERKSLAQSLTGKQVSDARRTDKSLDSGLKRVEAAIAEEDELAKTRTAALKQAQTDWNKELTALKDVLP